MDVVRVDEPSRGLECCINQVFGDSVLFFQDLVSPQSCQPGGEGDT